MNDGAEKHCLKSMQEMWPQSLTVKRPKVKLFKAQQSVKPGAYLKYVNFYLPLPPQKIQLYYFNL